MLLARIPACRYLFGFITLAGAGGQQDRPSAAFGTQQKHPVTIEVYYGGVLCPCAQWVPNIKAPLKEREHIYLERGNPSLPDANTLWDGEHLPFKLRLKGRYKPGKGLPEGVDWPRGNPDPARVFRYTSLTVLQNGPPRR